MKMKMVVGNFISTSYLISVHERLVWMPNNLSLVENIFIILSLWLAREGPVNTGQ